MAIIPWNGFENLDFGAQELFPAIDVYETETDIIAEIRGFEGVPENMDLSIQNGILIIRGEHGAQEERTRKGFWSKKAVSESFERAIQLPVSVDTASAKAVMENDVIRINVPKARGKEKTNKKLKITKL